MCTPGKARKGTLAYGSRDRKARIKTYELPQRKRAGVGELRVALPWVIISARLSVCFSAFG